MTTAAMALAELAEKGADVDVLRQMMQFMASRVAPGMKAQFWRGFAPGPTSGTCVSGSVSAAVQGGSGRVGWAMPREARARRSMRSADPVDDRRRR
jgi:hypothetical protein